MKWKLLIGMLLLLVVVGCNFSSPIAPEQEFQEPEELAMVDAQVNDFGYNELDEREIIVSYWLYNYGNVEAKDVYVRCFMQDDYYNKIFDETRGIGNVASQSYIYKEMYGNNGGMSEELYYTTYCYVTDCEGCDILVERVPELKEMIKNEFR